MAVSDEIRSKAGPKHFEAIFVGYGEVCVGWHVRDLKGKYFFSCDVIFNEDFSGHFGLPHSLPDASIPAPSSPKDHPSRHCVRTIVGQEFDEVLCLKELCC